MTSILPKEELEEIGRQVREEYANELRTRKSHLAREGPRAFECGGPDTIMPCKDCQKQPFDVHGIYLYGNRLTDEEAFQLFRSHYAVEVNPRPRRTLFQVSFDSIVLVMLGCALGMLVMWFIL